jgi:hypothetical protein
MTSLPNSRNSPLEQNGNNPLGRPSEEPRKGSDVDQRTARIRELNDLVRRTGRGGMVLLTNGIGALGLPAVNRIFAAVASFSDFSSDNDPWSEHDSAVMKVEGVEIIWKIDYLDRIRQFHSPDPADPKVTVRVLTVMLAAEY